jgi:hypothetical protein
MKSGDPQIHQGTKLIGPQIRPRAYRPVGRNILGKNH